ncbi:hypothetical protein, partial [uncultured Thiodictyon sp.]
GRHTALSLPTSIIGASGQVQPVPIALGEGPGGAAGGDPGRRPPASTGRTSIRPRRSSTRTPHGLELADLDHRRQ